MDQNDKLDFIISELQQMQHTFSSQVSSVENKVDGMQKQMTEMQGQLFDLQGNVSDLQQNVSDLQGNVSDLQQNVSDLQEQVSENTQFINVLVNGQARIEEKVDKLQNSYRFLEEATARNWNDIIELKKAT